jgi:5-methylcytosine-specific restriction enzyme subunit McrC
MTVITLDEWGDPANLELGPGEARELHRLEGVLDVKWTGSGLANVKAREGFVGSALLSPDLIIEVRPKVPISALLDLVVLAYRGQRLPLPVGQTLLGGGSARDWVGFLLVLETEHLLARGIRRGYINCHDDPPYIRGRIDFGSSLRRWGRPGRLVCEFADFSMDTPENRIVVGTLSLLQSPQLHEELQVRVNDLLERLNEVTWVRPQPRDLEELRLTRLNQHYRPTLDLCGLILNGFGLTSRPGEFSVGSFFLPMEVIFERAVAHWLKDNLPGRVTTQSTNSLAITHREGHPNPGVTIRPDLLWTLPEGRRVVMDTKYAKAMRQRQFGGWGFKNDHIYQIATYAIAHACPGVLLYPKTEDDIGTTYELDGTPLTIQTIDLAMPGLEGLRGLSDALLSQAEASAA